MEINQNHYYIVVAVVGAVPWIFYLLHRTSLSRALAVFGLFEALLYGAATLGYAERVLGVTIFVIAALAVTAVILPFKGARWFHRWAGATCPRNLFYLVMVVALIVWVLPLENIQPMDVPQGAVSLAYWIVGVIPNGVYDAIEKAQTHDGGPILVFAKPPEKEVCMLSSQ